MKKITFETEQQTEAYVLDLIAKGSKFATTGRKSIVIF